MTNLIIKLFIKDSSEVKNPVVRQRYGIVSGFVGIFCNIFLFAAKLLIGSLSGAISVIADAFNNLSDAGSCVVSIIGFYMGNKPADSEHPYGHGRIEYISSLIISFLIMLMGFELFKTSFNKILNPEPLDTNWIMIGVLVLSVIVKMWMAAFNRKIGHTINSTTLIATAKDSLSDVFATSTVIISLIVYLFFKIPLDGIMGAIVSVLIFFTGITSAKDSISPLLGEKPDPEMIQTIKERVLSYDGVEGIHDLEIHNYGPGRCFVSLHAEVPANTDIMLSHEIIDSIERTLADELNIQVTIHMDPIVTDDEQINTVKKDIQEIIISIDSSYSIHDFRMVQGPHHTNVIFDVVTPIKTKFTDQELKEIIQKKITEYDDNFRAVLTIDKDLT